MLSSRLIACTPAEGGYLVTGYLLCSRWRPPDPMFLLRACPHRSSGCLCCCLCVSASLMRGVSGTVSRGWQRCRHRLAHWEALPVQGASTGTPSLSVFLQLINLLQLHLGPQTCVLFPLYGLESRAVPTNWSWDHILEASVFREVGQTHSAVAFCCQPCLSFPHQPALAMQGLCSCLQLVLPPSSPCGVSKPPSSKGKASSIYIINISQE